MTTTQPQTLGQPTAHIETREYAVLALQAAGSSVQVTLTPVKGAAAQCDVWLPREAVQTQRITVGHKVYMTLEFTGEIA